MKSAPNEIDGAKVICVSPIDARHKPTGNTRHITGGKLLRSVSGLAICQYSGEDEFYLFYCDPNWVVLTDTLFPTVAKAKEQAEFEYSGVNQTWKNING